MAPYTFSEPWNQGTSVKRFPYPLWGAQTSHYIKVEPLAGPVFPVERKNDYSKETPKTEKTQDLKNLTAPVFNIGKIHHTFQVDVIQNIEVPKSLVGPKYSEDDGKSGYVPPKPIADITPEINAPVFKGVEASNKFTPKLPPKSLRSSIG